MLTAILSALLALAPLCGPKPTLPRTEVPRHISPDPSE